jgi:hypothetical protein
MGRKRYSPEQIIGMLRETEDVQGGIDSLPKLCISALIRNLSTG